MHVQTPIGASPGASCRTAHYQEVVQDAGNGETREMRVCQPHALTGRGNEDAHVGDRTPRGTKTQATHALSEHRALRHTSSPMERISSIALLLVTTPSRSLKSNVMRPSRNSSWKWTLRMAPAGKPEISVSARS